MPAYTPQEKAAIEAALRGAPAPSASEDSTLLSDTGNWVGQHAALAGNSAAFGMGPKLAYLAGAVIPGEDGQGERWEQEANKYIKQAREENPISGVIAELAGGLAVPIPGMGAGKAALGGIKALKGSTGVANAARLIGEGVIGGATSGAVRGATQGYGEGGTSGVANGLSAGLEGAKGGALAGGIFGGALGTGSALLSNRANSARMAATGGGSGDIKDVMRMTNTRSIYKTWQDAKANELARASDELNIIGHHPFQSASNVAQRATDQAHEYGVKLGSVVAEISSDPTTRVRTNNLIDVAYKNYNKIVNAKNSTPEELAAADQYGKWLQGLLSKHGSKIGVDDMSEMREGIRKTLQGYQGTVTPTDNITNGLIKAFRDDMGTLMVQAAGNGKLKPELAKTLADVSSKFHDAATIRDLSQNASLRWDATRETPLGKGIMSMFTTLGMSPYIGGIPARVLGGLTTRPGATPNTLIWMDKLRRNGAFNGKLQAPSSAKLGGVAGAGMANQLFSQD